MGSRNLAHHRHPSRPARNTKQLLLVFNNNQIAIDRQIKPYSQKAVIYLRIL
jgi:hypothetical protein